MFNELGRYLNDKVFQRQVLPEAIFTIRPSAELSSEQTVGTGGDPLVYPYHDKLFRSFLEQWRKTSPAEILLWYSEGTLAEHLGCEADTSAKPSRTHAVLSPIWNTGGN